MKKSVKAALWSAVVFPGAGQFLLGLYVRGSVLLGITAVAMYYIVQDVLARGLIEKVNDLVYRISVGEIKGDIGSVAGLIDLGPDPISVEIVSWVILFCWIFSIVDAYRLGERQEIGRTNP